MARTHDDEGWRPMSDVPGNLIGLHAEQHEAIAGNGRVDDMVAQWPPVDVSVPSRIEGPVGFVPPLKRAPDDTTDWQAVCRYCGEQMSRPQGRAAHERVCASRPTVPPITDGPVSVAIIHPTPTDARWTWQALRDGIVVADGLGRTWYASADCESDARNYLNGAWSEPSRASLKHAVKAVERRTAAAARRGPGRPPKDGSNPPGPNSRRRAKSSTPARKAPTPAVPTPADTPADSLELLRALDKIADGAAWPTSAIPDVAEWIDVTNRLLRKAIRS